MGNETFESNWSNNQTAQFAFVDANLERSEFDEVLAARLDLTTNTYTHIANVEGGGRRLSIRVTEPTGTVANSPADISVDWVDFNSGPAANVIQIPQNTAQNTQYIIATPPANAPFSILLLSTSDNFSAGEAEAYISRANVESFEVEWPAPTPGLE